MYLKQDEWRAGTLPRQRRFSLSDAPVPSPLHRRVDALFPREPLALLTIRGFAENSAGLSSDQLREIDSFAATLVRNPRTRSTLPMITATASYTARERAEIGDRRAAAVRLALLSALRRKDQDAALMVSVETAPSRTAPQAEVSLSLRERVSPESGPPQLWPTRLPPGSVIQRDPGSTIGPPPSTSQSPGASDRLRGKIDDFLRRDLGLKNPGLRRSMIDSLQYQMEILGKGL